MHFRRTLYLAAWPLAALLFASAGCSNSDNPVAPPADTVAPTVSSTNPADGATGVAIITATFSEAMNASTISASTFAVSGPGVTPVVGTVSYNSSTYIATFTPTSALAASTAYAATITTGSKDVAGNALANNRVWNFTTAAASSNQASVPLAGAGPFVILAGSTVTNTGVTNLTGDMGVSPGTAVTGFPPGTLTGTQQKGNAASALAMTDSDHGVQRRRWANAVTRDDRRESRRVDLASGSLQVDIFALDLVGRSHARRAGRCECRLHLSDGIDAHHDIRSQGDPERWRQVDERLLAGRQFGDLGNDVGDEGHHHGESVDHSEYRRDAERQGAGTDRRGYIGGQHRRHAHAVTLEVWAREICKYVARLRPVLGGNRPVRRCATSRKEKSS